MNRRAVGLLGLVVVLALGVGLLPAVLAAPSSAALPPFSRLSGFALDHHRARVAPDDYTAYRLDVDRIAGQLRAPSAVVAVPDPDGGSQRFAVEPTAVMAPGLAAAHPEIRTYAGRGLDDPTRTIRLDVTPMGFRASVRGPGGARAWYVDPAYDERGAVVHLSYYGAAVPAAADAFVERDLADTAAALAAAPAARAPGAPVELRTYRLAFLTDPSYAAYFGSANVLSEKVTLINRVDQVYNDDLAIRLVLIDGTDALNLDTAAKATGVDGPCGASACFSASQLETCSSATLSRTGWVLGQLVGADSFDLGHLGLGVSGGGIAGLGVVGGADKSSGCTGVPTPEGDYYAVDYVAHEMGHQFGGDHTFNGTQVNCSLTNRNGATSVEPGSGSSVMAYAGICGQDDLQPHSDPYFSQRSIDEITDTTAADPGALNEIQTITLRGFDTDGDTVTLTFPGHDPVTLTRGSTDYTVVGVTAAIRRLTGYTPRVQRYDGGATLTDDGFQLTFNAASGAGGRDVPRLGIGATTGGVSAFVGVQVQGGPEGNGGTASATPNHAPTVTAPADKTLPIRTPFTLTGSGTDADGDALTYLWEQNDEGSVLPTGGTALVSNTKTDGPLFRVFGVAATVSSAESHQSPSPGENLADGSTSRTFPDLTQVLAGNTNAQTGSCPAAPADTDADVPAAVIDCYSEFLPTADYAGPMHFRLTARDGYAAGGGTSYDDVVLTLDSSAGPFLVTSRRTPGEPAVGGGPETVTWDVNGTDAAGLAPTVRISLSTDGGLTYPSVLAVTTPNDGSAAVTLPAVDTDHARIKVEAVGNYFFDVNDADFAIATDDPPAPDTQAPDTAITRAPKAFTLGRAVLRYDATETGSTFECTLDGAARACGSDGLVLTGVRPGTHVFTVAARDAAGNLDATPAAARFAAPYPATTLTASRGDWKRGDGFVKATSRGATLTRRAADVSKLALVVGTGPGFGRVEVSLDGKRLRTFSLAGERRTRVLLPVITLASLTSGRLRITTINGKAVRIEGVGLL
jgi:hypothetical protein